MLPIKKYTPFKLLLYGMLVSILLLESCDNVLVPSLDRQNLLATGLLISLQDTSATIIGEIVDLNRDRPLFEHGHCWDTLNPPSIDKNCTQLGLADQVGSFESQLNELRPLTEYYVRAYIREGEDIKYGSVIHFTTGGNSTPPLSLRTLRIFNIASERAQVLGEIRGRQNIQDYGFVWSTNPAPSLEMNQGKEGLGSLELNGETEFITILDSLKANTQYFLRPYALFLDPDSNVVYGESVDFLTAQ